MLLILQHEIFSQYTSQFSVSYNKYFNTDESRFKSTVIVDNTAASFDDSNEKTLVDEDNASINDYKSPKSKILLF